MRVGVLGGGLQGCCAALAIADRGVPVTIFDRNRDPVTRAGAANEGKIHLGYMHAGDPSLKTRPDDDDRGARLRTFPQAASRRFVAGIADLRACRLCPPPRRP
ncbi:FAD-dependent oxidoreductase, partial [Hyphomonas sp.]